MKRRRFNQALVVTGGSLIAESLTSGCGPAPSAATGAPRSPATPPEPPSLAGTPQGVASAQASAESERAAAPVTPAGSPATAKVPLGRSGLVVPRIAMGTGSGGWARESDQTRLGQSAFTHLMRHGGERGATFIDAADLYGSHPFVREALREVPRDQWTLLSKIWFRPDAPKMPTTETAIPEVHRFLKELGTDHIDVVLVHAVVDPRWPSQQARMRDELSALKQAGKVRAVGCSAHTHAALRVAAEDPWVDVIFARINPGKKRMDEDASVEEVANTLRLARANGKGVVGMKIYGAGEWNSEEQRRQSLKYALEGGLVDAMTIGSLSPEQFDDTVRNTESVLRG